MENKSLNIALMILKVSLVIAGIFLCAAIAVNGDPSEVDSTLDVAAAMVEQDSIRGIISVTIKFSVVMIIIAAGAAVVFGLLNLAKNIKKSIPTLIGFGVFALIVIISYSLTTNSIPVGFEELEDGTLSNVKLGQASMYTFGIMMVVALLAIVGGEVRRVLK